MTSPPIRTDGTPDRRFLINRTHLPPHTRINGEVDMRMFNRPTAYPKVGPSISRDDLTDFSKRLVGFSLLDNVPDVPPIPPPSVPSVQILTPAESHPDSPQEMNPPSLGSGDQIASEDETTPSVLDLPSADLAPKAPRPSSRERSARSRRGSDLNLPPPIPFDGFLRIPATKSKVCTHCGSTFPL